MVNRKLTRKRLKEVLHYDPNTGLFTWLMSKCSRAQIGEVAGSINVIGYVSICIDWERCLAHRVAWFYMTGRWPRFEIDHKNGVRHDNKWHNLRNITRKLNAQNVRKANKNNALGILGVRKMRKRFQSQIEVNGKLLCLGTYDTPELAHAVYVKAKRKFHPGCTI